MDARRRLVEAKHLRAVGERGGDGEQLLLAAGDGARRLMRDWRQHELFEQFVGAPAAAQASAREGGEEAGIPALGGEQHLAHAHARWHAWQLEGAHQAAPGNLGGRKRADRLAAQQDLAGIHGDEAGEQVQQRRFAGAVGAEQANDAAACDREIDIVEHDMGAEGLAQLLRGKGDLNHERYPAFPARALAAAAAGSRGGRRRSAPGASPRHIRWEGRRHPWRRAPQRRAPGSGSHR